MVRLTLLPILYFLGTSFFVYAQQDREQQIDSLERILPASKDKGYIHFELAQLYAGIDSISAFTNAQLGLAIVKNKLDKYGMAQGNFTLGNLKLDYNQSIVAEKHYRIADSILTSLIKTDSSYKNLRLWVRINFNTNVALSYRGLNKDIEYLEKISPIARKIGAYDILAKANSNLAINFYNNEQYNIAYKYFLKSGPQHKRMSDYSTFVEDRLIFSSCLIGMDSLDRAIIVLQKVKPIIDSLRNPVKLQIYHTILGEYYSKKGAFDQAIDNFQKAEQLLIKNKLIRNNLQLYIDFMEVYSQTKDYKNAIKYANISLHLTQKNKNKIMEAEIYKELAKYKYETESYQHAFKSLQNYVDISDSTNTVELEREINRLEAHYQSEKKERQILELQNQNNEVKLLLAQKRSQNYLLLLASMGFLCLAGFAYLGYRNLKKRDQLKANEIERLKYEQDAKISLAMLEGQENERKRIAIDLHDGLAGRLSATRIKLENLRQYSNDPKNGKEFKEAASNIDDSLSELRSIARNLMPETLFRYGLKNAIEDYCLSISQGNEAIKFILQFYDNEVSIQKNVLLTIYRIIQELINNAVKHSQATELLIQFLFDHGKADITVEDNGIGFLMNDVEEKGGMGLKNLKTRVAYLNGAIDFESNPGEGTTVHIVIDTKA